MVRLFGLIAVRWATLDDILAEALGAFIGNREAGIDIYFAVSSQGPRLDMLQAAIKHSKLPDNLKEMCASNIEKIGELWKRRNILLHNPVVATIPVSEMPTTAKPSPDQLTYSTWVRRPLRKQQDQKIPLLAKEINEHLSALGKASIAIANVTNPGFVAMLQSLHERQQELGLTGTEPDFLAQLLARNKESDDPPQSSEG